MMNNYNPKAFFIGFILSITFLYIAELAMGIYGLGYKLEIENSQLEIEKEKKLASHEKKMLYEKKQNDLISLENDIKRLSLRAKKEWARLANKIKTRKGCKSNLPSYIGMDFYRSEHRIKGYRCRVLVEVYSVKKNGPADSAGIKPGDIITGVENANGVRSPAYFPDTFPACKTFTFHVYNWFMTLDKTVEVGDYEMNPDNYEVKNNKSEIMLRDLYKKHKMTYPTDGPYYTRQEVQNLSLKKIKQKDVITEHYYEN